MCARTLSGKRSMYRCTEPEEWLPHIRRMLDAAEKAYEYAQGVKESDFLPGALEYDASLMQLVVLAEAANRVPPPVREALTGIVWHKIRGLRNRIAHDYESLEEDSVWNTVNVLVPELITTLREVLAQHTEE